MKNILITLFAFVVLFSKIGFTQEEGHEFLHPPITIVVLGSSTAEGMGPSTRDSAWVNRYRKYVQSFNPNNRVINLGWRGYSTYHILPHDSTYSPRRPSPDVDRNILKALEYDPIGIIVNMPSNDVANGYSVKEQMRNFQTLSEFADSNEVEIWMATTQPRNFPKSRHRNRQFELFQSITESFPEKHLDFWTGFTNNSYQINKKYDSGDGTHLNNEGHQLLLDRVIESRAFLRELEITSIQELVVREDQEEMSPNKMVIAFEGKIDRDLSTLTSPSIIQIVQNDRVIKESSASGSNYSIDAIVNFNLPFKIVFGGQQRLWKVITFDFSSIQPSDERPKDIYYPFESLDIVEIAWNKFAYPPNDSTLEVAHFSFDRKEMELELDLPFSHLQKNRLACFQKTKKRGTHTDFYSDSIKRSAIPFKKGQFHGNAKWFNTDGLLIKKISFRKGEYHGRYILYDQDGKEILRKKFNRGVQVGPVNSKESE